MAYNNNPIGSVNGVQVKCPSVYKWNLQDISSANAGRTEDTVMHKQRIGQCVKLELEWHNISIEDAAVILKQFNPEYIEITYLDAMAGKYLTSQFYVGDRTSPLYNNTKGIWSSIAFNVIERSGVKDVY